MPAKGQELKVTATSAPEPAPPGAIPIEKLLVGLRGQLQKDEHVLWQGRGSGRAFTVFNRALLLRFGLLAIAVAAIIIWMFSGPNQANGWVAWAAVAILAGRVALFVWRSSNTPSRQIAMLTTKRVVSVDELRPETSWSVHIGGEGRAEGEHLDPHPIVITGTKARGHIRLNQPPQKIRAYPPFILFNAENPLALAQLIQKTLKITQPIEDRTK